jgi:hypothetical protein
LGQLRGQVDGDVLGKSAVGISLLQDEYGAFKETEAVLSYASRIQLAEKTNLRLGAGVIYRGVRLNGNNLTTEQSGDPILSEYLGS